VIRESITRDPALITPVTASITPVPALVAPGEPVQFSARLIAERRADHWAAVPSSQRAEAVRADAVPAFAAVAAGEAIEDQPSRRVGQRGQDRLGGRRHDSSGGLGQLHLAPKTPRGHRP